MQPAFFVDKFNPRSISLRMKNHDSSVSGCKLYLRLDVVIESVDILILMHFDSVAQPHELL